MQNISSSSTRLIFGGLYARIPKPDSDMLGAVIDFAGKTGRLVEASKIVHFTLSQEPNHVVVNVFADYMLRKTGSMV